jgi:hypothetical protein
VRADTACSVHVISQGADESSLPDFSDDERAYQEKSWNSMIGCCIARHFAAEAYAKGEDKVIMNKVSSSTSQCMCASSWAPPTLRCLNPLLPCKDHHGAALRKVQGDVQGPVLPHHPQGSLRHRARHGQGAPKDSRRGNRRNKDLQVRGRLRLSFFFIIHLPGSLFFSSFTSHACRNTSGNCKHNRQL